MPVFEVLLLLALPLLLTLHAFVEEPAFAQRSHQLERCTTRNRRTLYLFPHQHEIAQALRFELGGF